MNRDVVYSKLPDEQTWAFLDGNGRKRAVEAAINSLLTELDKCDAEPDAWEAADIVTELDALLRGWYTLAWNCIARAMERPENRAKAWPRELHTPTVVHLLNRLAEVSGSPDRN